MLREWLFELSEVIVPLIEIIALVFIAFGAAEACIKGARAIWSPMNTARFASIWIRFSRWLIAGLTFQLAADIIETSAAPTWNEIGQLAVVAVIRTFLNYFLERDQRDMAMQLRESAQDPVPPGKSGGA